MKFLSILIILIMIIIVAGCRGRSKETPYWETAEFWDAPMDSSALDSIIEGRKHIIADNGKPYPIDEYEMCLYRCDVPKLQNIPLDSLIGTWYGYGHLYDPRTILTICEDSTYSEITESCGEYDDKGRLTYSFAYEKRGKYIYRQSENRLSFLNYNNPDSLSREAYMKSENPINEVRIIYAIEKDTMWIFDHSDLWCYFRSCE